MCFSLDLIYSAVLKACKQAECVNALVKKVRFYFHGEATGDGRLFFVSFCRK